MTEVAIEGWSEIAKMFGVSVCKMKGYRDELFDGGFVFYRNTRRGNRIVCAFPSQMMIWASIKGKKREAI